MDIFGVTPLEVIFIIILGLIVFGPERLPDIGRSIGRAFARVLAWQHQSPEAQMIQQIRQDINQEILELRDEIIRARQQLDVSAEANLIPQETRALISRQRAGAKSGGPVSTETQSPAAASVDASVAPEQVAPAQDGVSALTSPDPAPASPPGTLSIDSAPVKAPDTPAVEPSDVSGLPDLGTLSAQLRTLQADLYALHAQLQDRAMVAPDWKLPSQEQPDPHVYDSQT